MAYLCPDGAPDAEKVHRYLGVLEELVHRAAEAGIAVVFVTPPVPEAFRVGVETLDRDHLRTVLAGE